MHRRGQERMQPGSRTSKMPQKCRTLCWEVAFSPPLLTPSHSDGIPHSPSSLMTPAGEQVTLVSSCSLPGTSTEQESGEKWGGILGALVLELGWACLSSVAEISRSFLPCPKDDVSLH